MRSADEASAFSFSRASSSLFSSVAGAERVLTLSDVVVSQCIAMSDEDEDDADELDDDEGGGVSLCLLFVLFASFVVVNIL